LTNISPWPLRTLVARWFRVRRRSARAPLPSAIRGSTAAMGQRSTNGDGRRRCPSSILAEAELEAGLFLARHVDVTGPAQAPSSTVSPRAGSCWCGTHEITPHVWWSVPRLVPGAVLFDSESVPLELLRQLTRLPCSAARDRLIRWTPHARRAARIRFHGRAHGAHARQSNRERVRAICRSRAGRRGQSPDLPWNSRHFTMSRGTVGSGAMPSVQRVADQVCRRASSSRSVTGTGRPRFRLTTCLARAFDDTAVPSPVCRIPPPWRPC
jgi:hypothetical protein